MFTSGQTVESMRVSIRMIKNVVLVFTIGLMEENMKVGGTKANNMDLVLI